MFARAALNGDGSLWARAGVAVLMESVVKIGRHLSIRLNLHWKAIRLRRRFAVNLFDLMKRPPGSPPMDSLDIGPHA